MHVRVWGVCEGVGCSKNVPHANVCVFPLESFGVQ